MAPIDNLTAKNTHPASLGKRMLQGAAVALILISIFLLGAGAPDPNWGKYWMIRPILIVPAAGAMAGLCIYFLDYLRVQGGWKKTLAIVLSITGYLIALWMGTVLGLDGTMWD